MRVRPAMKIKEAYFGRKMFKKIPSSFLHAVPEMTEKI